MLFSKSQLTLYDLSYYLHEALIKIPEYDFSLLNPKGILTQEEETYINEFIPYFRFLVVQFLISDYCYKERLPYSDEEVGTINAKSFYSVLHHMAEKTDDEIITASEIIQNEFDCFIEYFSKYSDQDLQKQGIYFYLCSYFASKVEDQSGEEVQRLRNSTIFDLAKQIYKVVEDTFNVYTKSVKIISNTV